MRRHHLIAPALALALVLAGCGGDDGDDDARSTTTTTEADTEATTGPENSTIEATGGDEGDDATSTTEGTETTEAPDTTAGGGGGDASEFCAAYTALENIDDTEGFPDDPQTPQDYIDGFTTVLPYAEDALDVAPDEVRDDLQTLVDAISGLVDDLAGVDDLEEADALLQQVFTDEDLEQAGNQVDDYYEQNCPQAAEDDGAGSAEG